MGAALSIFVILSVSIFTVRVAAVALRITGLPDESARFQALSAFTGTGFTTSETEMVVNYPIRRRIVGLLMIIGNILESVTFLGNRRFHRLAEVGDGYSICEHPLASHWMDENGQLVDAEFAALEMSVLASRSPGGDVSVRDRQSGPVDAGDTVVLFGRDAGHEELGRSSRRAEPEVSVRD